MIKNIMGTVLAVAVAFGAGTNLSHTPPQTNTKKIVKASGTTTLSDHYSKVRFSRSSDIKTISKTYQLKNSDKISEIIYLPINDYSIDDAGGQNNMVSFETRLADYSVLKKGFYDQTTFIDSSNTTDHSFTLEKEVSTNYDFSISKKYHLDDSFEISKNQKEASIQIYTLNRTYDYQIWESDLSQDVSSDSYIGKGTIQRPIGVIIAVSANS